MSLLTETEIIEITDDIREGLNERWDLAVLAQHELVYPMELLDTPTLEGHPGYEITYAATHSDWKTRRAYTVVNAHWRTQPGARDDQAIVYYTLTHVGVSPWDTQAQWIYDVWTAKDAALTKDAFEAMVWAWIEDEPRRLSETAERAAADQAKKEIA